MLNTVLERRHQNVQVLHYYFGSKNSMFPVYLLEQITIDFIPDPKEHKFKASVMGLRSSIFIN